MIHSKQRQRRVQGSVGVDPNQNAVTIDDVVETTIAAGSEVGVLDASDVRIDPAKEHTTAASPHAARLSDGSSFYKALTDTELRATAVPVSLSSVTPGTGATNLGKAEDSPAATGDTGVVMLAQRHDAFTSTVSANEDYSTLHVNSIGQLKVTDSSMTDGNQITGIYDPVATGLTANVFNSDPSSFESGLVVRPIPNTSIDTPITGTVAVTQVVPGTLGTQLGKAEDSAHSTGHTGVFVLGVQNSAGGSMVSADGDYSPFQMDSVGSLRVTNTSITPGTGATNLGKAEDAAHASGDVGIFPLSVRTDTLFQYGSNDGDYVPFQSNLYGHQKVAQYGLNGLPIFTNAVLGTWDLNFTSIGDPITLGIAEINTTAPTAATNGMAVRTIPSGRYSLTASAPAAVSVGVASGALVTSNASRKGLIIRNTSANTVSLNLAGGAAVLNSGVTLSPGGTFEMGDYDFTTAAINAIASAAASNVAVQEFT